MSYSCRHRIDCRCEAPWRRRIVRELSRVGWCGHWSRPQLSWLPCTAASNRDLVVRVFLIRTAIMPDLNNSHMRTYGKGSRSCRVCKTRRGAFTIPRLRPACGGYTQREAFLYINIVLHGIRYLPPSRLQRLCNGLDFRFDGCAGLIRKYHLMVCRRCFRERAETLGFQKVRFPCRVVPSPNSLCLVVTSSIGRLVGSC